MIQLDPHHQARRRWTIYWAVGLALWGCDAGGDRDGSIGAGAPGDASPADASPADAPADASPDLSLADVSIADASPDQPLRPEPGARPRFRFPIRAEDRALIRSGPIFHVDHDPADGNRIGCTNYQGQGFPWCYDGHEGTDFLLLGGFSQMDRASAWVVAAAGGEVVEVRDGNYDRCHGSAETGDVSCDGQPMRANRVALRHAGGWVSEYLHLKKGSVAVAVGERVECGERLGEIGSSGRSTVPHLHFQVAGGGEEVVDPYSSEAGASLWVAQDTDVGLPGDTCDPAWTPAPEAEVP